MKIIAQVLVYEEGEFLERAIKPWVNVCESIDIFEGAFQTTTNLGYPARSQDQTIDVAKKLSAEFNNVNLVHHNEWNEPILRNNHLHNTIKKYGRDDTVLFILDGDEIYSPEDVRRCYVAIHTQWEWRNRWWISMRNFIAPDEYYMGFNVPRFAKLKTALGFDSYNGIAYSDGVKEIDIEDVLPEHMSWFPLDKAKRKIEWQEKALGWQCSFKIVGGKVALNDDYYTKNNKEKPVIHKL